jgi:NADPH2 dehydrogenase
MSSRYNFSKEAAAVSFKDTALFKPIKVGAIELQHRVALAPLTRLRNVENTPNAQLMGEYYSQRSQRPGTLLVTEATFISAAAGGYTSAPGIFSDEQIEAWTKIHKGIHDNKSFVFQQLWALGRQSSPAVLAKQGLKFVSASEIYQTEESEKEALAAENPLHALTIPEIKEYVKDYVQAAKNALKAGADGVEIHSANGYLLNQFVDPKSNKRTDEYGGSSENRARFTLEVVDAVVEAIGAERVAIRFSPFGFFGNMSGFDRELIKTYEYLYAQLEERASKGHRLAYIHLVEARFPDIVSAPLQEKDLSEDQTNDNVYNFWKGVVLRVGDYGVHPQIAKRDVAKPNTLIGYGRFFIANPDLPDRLEKGLQLTAYDRASFYLPNEVGYTDYPFYKDQESTSSL